MSDPGNDTLGGGSTSTSIRIQVFLPPANEVWDKVIFSEACVKNSVHKGWGCAWSGGGAWSREVPGPRGLPGPNGVPGPRGVSRPTTKGGN